MRRARSSRAGGSLSSAGMMVRFLIDECLNGELVATAKAREPCPSQEQD